MTAAQQISVFAQTRGTIAPLERVRGEARISVRDDCGSSRLERLYQSGSAKIRLPRVDAGSPLEAILINTAGGVTGGDRLAYSIAVGKSARAVATTQAAERIYRRLAGVAEIETTLTVGEEGRLDWLPQETIVFDRSAFSRRLTADVNSRGSLLAVESVVLGRTAMREIVGRVHAFDSWRIRRDGKLVFADAVGLDGDATAIMAGPATGRGAKALATVVLVAPDAETLLGPARSTLSTAQGEVAASAWNGILVTRLIADSGQALRADLTRLIEALRAQAMPRGNQDSEVTEHAARALPGR